MRRRPRQFMAFTLIESLVLVPVIGLALAAFVATTQRSTQQDNLAACLANLRTIGQASLTYAAEDPNEMMIPIPALEALPNAPGPFEWGGKAGIGQAYSLGQPASSLWGTGVWRGAAEVWPCRASHVTSVEPAVSIGATLLSALTFRTAHRTLDSSRFRQDHEDSIHTSRKAQNCSSPHCEQHEKPLVFAIAGFLSLTQIQ